MLVEIHGDNVSLAVQNGNFEFPEAHCYSDGLVDLLKKMLILKPKKRLSLVSLLEELGFLMVGDNLQKDFTFWNINDHQRVKEQIPQASAKVDSGFDDFADFGDDFAFDDGDVFAIDEPKEVKFHSIFSDEIGFLSGFNFDHVVIFISRIQEKFLI